MKQIFLLILLVITVILYSIALSASFAAISQPNDIEMAIGIGSLLTATAVIYLVGKFILKNL